MQAVAMQRRESKHKGHEAKASKEQIMMLLGDILHLSIQCLRRFFFLAFPPSGCQWKNPLLLFRFYFAVCPLASCCLLFARKGLSSFSSFFNFLCLFFLHPFSAFMPSHCLLFVVSSSFHDIFTQRWEEDKNGRAYKTHTYTCKYILKEMTALLFCAPPFLFNSLGDKACYFLTPTQASAYVIFLSSSPLFLASPQKIPSISLSGIKKKGKRPCFDREERGAPPSLSLSCT